ncbi:hypothetical protein [Muricoccus radiodurans]|uniref:capsular polysaccharide export protein, LipB/KpsS family n=1 Tax=Muricoccus radiodurans TaxID=2231721 RepID=UPI003CEB1D19
MASPPPPLAFPPATLSRWPHLPAFWPERKTVAAGTRGSVLVLPEDVAAPPGTAVLRFALGPFAPPRFGERDAPVLLLTQDAPPLFPEELEECIAPAAAAGLPGGEELAALLARSRAADPFVRGPITRAAALEMLVAWRAAERENRSIAVCLGLSRWKRGPVASLLAHGAGGPAFVPREEEAVRQARAADGAVLAWAADMPPARAAAIRAQGVGLRLLEDGFIRSRGLGARFLPGASYCLDEGAHYDPGQPSGLEALLQRGGFPPALLARAAALRQAIVRRGVTKYNLAAGGALPPIPPGRRAVLVPGQVEDDASIRRGADRVRTNLDLLRAVRAAEPDAFILYKPHPDLEAGYRRGRLRARDLEGLADHVVTGVPLPALLPQVAAVHTMTSLSGFEAILRDVPVTTWGRPFYAGWGRTTHRGAPFPEGRRGVERSVEELVAAALILYPRYIDPVTRLPCPVEVVLERLEDPSAWRPAPLTLHRGLEGWVRRGLTRLAGWR